MKNIRSLFGQAATPGQGKREKGAPFPWKVLEGHEALSHLRDIDATRPKVVFKHSTRCGLSGMMLRRFEKHWDPARDRVECYLLDVLAHREVSQQLAEAFGIAHQSPQVLVIRGGKVTDHASHGGIDGLMPEAL